MAIDQATKDKLTRLAGYAGTATGGVQKNYYNAPIVTKTGQVTAPAPRTDFASKVKAVVGQTANITGQVAMAGAKFVKNSGVDIYQKGFNTVKTGIDFQTQPYQAEAYRKSTEELGRRQDAVIQAYKTGKMGKEDYLKALKDLGDGFAEVSKANNKIVTGPSPQKRAMDMVETAATVLSFGSLGVGAVSGGAAYSASKEGGKVAVKELIDQSATSLEKKMLQSKAVRSLVTRNIEAVAKREGQQIVGESAWQFTKRNMSKVAADLLIKRPVFYQSNIGQTQSLYKNILEHDVKGAATDAAWLGLQMIDGGPIGAIKNLAGYTKSGVKKLTYGNESFIDEASRRFGTRKGEQIAQYVRDNPSAERAWRIMQDGNVEASGGNVKRAADNFMANYSWMTDDQLAKLTPQQLTQDAENWVKAVDIKKSLVGKFNLSAEDVAKLTPARWDAAMRTSVADAVKAAGDDKEAMLKTVQSFGDNPAVGFAHNENLMQQIEGIINTSKSADEAAKRIQAIDAALTSGAIPQGIQKKLAKLGFTLVEPVGGVLRKDIDFEDTKKLVSGAIKNADLFDPSAAPQPTMKSLAGMMKRFGVSPEESNTEAYKKVSESVAHSLAGTEAGSAIGFKVGDDVARGGEVVLSKMQQFVENKVGIRGLDAISAGKSSLVDIRQMTLGEIQDALKYKNQAGKYTQITRAQAKEVRNAVLKGYQEVPLELRGMGDKIVDTLYRVNPAQKYYSRIQSAMRYTYNPFFRVQESAETKIGSHAIAHNLIWNKSKAQLDEGAKILDEARIFSGTLPGEAAGDQVLGRITANLTPGQKRDLAGAALDIAESQGKPLANLVAENPEAISDALKIIVQYPNKGILSSPLARTMNLVFFPMRYNAKVTKVAADVLGKESPAVQKAVIHSLFQFKNWLKSDEGINWQSQNADALQLFSWITPINSITQTLKLLSGDVHSWGDVGQIGGLPLGVITQILDGQGIISLNRPYVDPKTGNVFPRNIPKTTQARAATALVDVLNTTFTYPGRILGLPGKTAMLRGAVKNFIDTQGSDFESRIEMDKLTPAQLNMIRVIKENGSQDSVDAVYNSPAPGQFRGYTLPPPMNFPAAPPKLDLKIKGSKGKKGKKIARAPGPR